MTRKYIGNGVDFVPGLPLGEVSDDQWAALDDRQRAAADKLYKKVGKPKADAKKEAVKKDGDK